MKLGGAGPSDQGKPGLEKSSDMLRNVMQMLAVSVLRELLCSLLRLRQVQQAVLRGQYDFLWLGCIRCPGTLPKHFPWKQDVDACGRVVLPDGVAHPVIVPPSRAVTFQRNADSRKREEEVQVSSNKRRQREAARQAPQTKERSTFFCLFVLSLVVCASVVAVFAADLFPPRPENTMNCGADCIAKRQGGEQLRPQSVDALEGPTKERLRSPNGNMHVKDM